MGHVGSVVLVWVEAHSLVVSFDGGACWGNWGLSSRNPLLQMQKFLLVLRFSTSKSYEWLLFFLNFLRLWSRWNGLFLNLFTWTVHLVFITSFCKWLCVLLFKRVCFYLGRLLKRTSRVLLPDSSSFWTLTVKTLKMAELIFGWPFSLVELWIQRQLVHIECGTAHSTSIDLLMVWIQYIQIQHGHFIIFTLIWI